MSHSKNPGRGFTLIELLVVLAIVAVLTSIIFAMLSTAKERGRDTQRVSALHEIQTALEIYYTRHSVYPDGDAEVNGWDTPADGDFIDILIQEDLLPATPIDPIQASLPNNLRYFRFDAGTDGCDIERGDYYVLGVADMETSDNAPHELSPGWSCPGRDWGDVSNGGFEYVVGKFES